MMKCNDFIVKDAIVTDLQATNKKEVLAELVQALVKSGRLNDSDSELVVEALLKRESLGSTGIGRGVAVPHTKLQCVDNMIGCVGISRDGVNFDALDSEDVKLFFLLISPPDRPGDHLRALEHLTMHVKSDNFIHMLEQATSADAVSEMLETADSNDGGDEK